MGEWRQDIFGQEIRITDDDGCVAIEVGRSVGGEFLKFDLDTAVDLFQDLARAIEGAKGRQSDG